MCSRRLYACKTNTENDEDGCDDDACMHAFCTFIKPYAHTHSCVSHYTQSWALKISFCFCFRFTFHVSGIICGSLCCYVLPDKWNVRDEREIYKWVKKRENITKSMYFMCCWDLLPACQCIIARGKYVFARSCECVCVCIVFFYMYIRFLISTFCCE